MSHLQMIWFALIAALLVLYAILGGADLGAGVLQLFTPPGRQRNAALKAIGPFWDGNQVWLVLLGGASFAAFPPVYAAIFSGFYLALILLVLALIFRAVSIEIPAHQPPEGSERYWDFGLGAGSLLAALLLGVAFGNILRGIPLTQQGDYAGTFFGLLNPFAVLIGVVNVAMLATHGGVFLQLRTLSDLRDPARKRALWAWALYLPLLIAAIIVTARRGHLLVNYAADPVLWIVPGLGVVMVALTGALSIWRKPRLAVAASTTGIALVLASAAIGLYPVLVPALGNPALSLTAANASSSPLTLKSMLVIALLGLPLVAVYTTWLHRVFGGETADAEGAEG